MVLLPRRLSPAGNRQHPDRCGLTPERGPRGVRGLLFLVPQLSLAARPAPRLDWQVDSPVGLDLRSTSSSKGPSGNLPAFSLNSLFLPFHLLAGVQSPGLLL